MKKPSLNNILQWALYAAVFLLGYAAITTVGTLFGIEAISAPAAAREADVYQVRSGLLMDAMADVGVCEPQDAATLWAEGLKTRSAARQYAAMNETLKKEYARQLEKTFPNWVTGVSSPWVDRYEITELKSTGKDTHTYRLRFYLATSTGPAGAYDATLTVVQEDGFWRIAAIKADRELEAYMGFRP